MGLIQEETLACAVRRVGSLRGGMISASYNRYANGAFVPVMERGSKILG